MLLFLASIVLGIIALCGMSEHGQEGILWRSVRGIVMGIAMLWLMGTGFVHGWQTAMQNRKAVAAITQASQEVREETKKDFNRDQKITVESAQPKLDKMKNALDGAAKDGSPETALLANASKAYLEKLQGLMNDYAATAKMLQSPPVLDMNGVDRQEQLQGKRKIVENFLAANEKFMAFVTKGDKAYRDELVRFKVPAATVEATLKGYRSTASERNFMLIKIRETDQRIGTAMLGMLDVLDANWGGWKYNKEKRNPLFSDASALEKYNDYFKEIKSAAAEQKQLQTQLVNMPELASNK
ncbi:MAG TPA: hypothetical protein VFC07_04340 [Verrucomicrobiae bacterium]|nr:hypothetical protein [Verrucomicrobiae bacterium]